MSFDEDLSTLSKLRISNRQSKQRLKNELDETNTIDLILKNSPTKTKIPSPLRNTYTSNDLDTSILNKENSIFSDHDTYEKISHSNDLKREKLSNIPDLKHDTTKFNNLFLKYNLKTESPKKDEAEELQNKLIALQLKYNKLKSNDKELNQYIEFMELNFEKIYKKLNYYKRENKELYRVNIELSKLTEKYRSLLNDEETEHDDLNTKNLLNMNFK